MLWLTIVLHLLSHEEANLTTEQQKESNRQPSPAYFPYNGKKLWFLKILVKNVHFSPYPLTAL